DITGATSDTYTLTVDERGKYLKVVVTGNGEYTGDATSAAAGPVSQEVTAIDSITGTLKVGEELTAGAVTPAGATVDYQWQWSETSDGTY
ncbi:hypothetical protein, partial [Salidesulfovibrio brasiliensis]